MATTFAKQSASPYSLKYAVSSTGGGAQGSLTAAQILADCVAGPLKAFLTEINSTSNPVPWPAVERTSYISVYISNLSADGIAAADFNGPPNGFEANGKAAGGGAIVEIRFQPPLVR